MNLHQAEVTAFVARFWMLGAVIFFAGLALRLVRSMRKRKAPVTGTVLLTLVALAPLVYQGLVAAQLTRETYIRFGHPMAVVAVTSHVRSAPSARAVKTLGRSIAPPRAPKPRSPIVCDPPKGLG